MGHEYRCKSGRTTFERVDGRQKISRKDAQKIRAARAELPYMEGFNADLAKVYGVTASTIGRILRNQLHAE